MFPQMLIDGLMLGFVYAIVAIGYTMVYGALEFINWAHGDIFMCGAFIGGEILLFMQAAGLIEGNAMLSLILALLLAMFLTGSLGVAIERVAYKPLRSAPKLVPLISAFGVAYVLEDGVRIVEGFARNSFFLHAPSMFDQRVKLGMNIEIGLKTLIIMFIGILMMIVLTLFVNKTKTGRAIRAVAQDQTCASLMAIDVNRIISLTFFVGTGMAGAAGTLFAVQYSLVNPLLGFIIGLKAFIAAVVGGIGNIPGAMLGGLLLGVFESLGSGYLSILTNGVFGAEYKDVLAFIILIIVLIAKPSGLLGKATSEKV